MNAWAGEHKAGVSTLCGLLTRATGVDTSSVEGTPVSVITKALRSK